MSSTNNCELVRSRCVRVFSSLEQPVTVQAIDVLDQIRIQYTSARLSAGEQDPTIVKLRWYPANREFWISYLRVSTRIRGFGVGRRLAATCERLASLLGARQIHVFALYQARGFWLTIGYEPDGTVRQLLTKFVTTQTGEDLTWTSN